MAHSYFLVGGEDEYFLQIQNETDKVFDDTCHKLETGVMNNFHKLR